MATLGMFIATDGVRAEEMSGRKSDTVIELSELFSGEVKAELGAPWSRILIVADSVKLLRAVLPALSSMTCRTKLIELVVAGRPRTGMLSVPNRPIGPRAVVSADRTTVDKPHPHVRLTVRLGGMVRLSDALAALLEGGPAPFQRPLGGLRVGIANDRPEAMRWACGDPSAIRLDPGQPIVAAEQPSTVDIVLDRPAKPDDHHPSVLDLGRRGHQPRWSDLANASREVLEGLVARERLETLVPPVDTDTLTPIGFTSVASDDEAWVQRRAHASGASLAIADRKARSNASFDEWSGLSERVVDEVRHYQVVHDDPSAHSGPVEQASFLAQAACAALPVLTHGLSATVHRMLGKPLADAMTAATREDLRDPIRREWHCMSIRRLAFKQHGARRRWNAIARDIGTWAREPLPVSVVLATRRPDLLPRIAQQVAAQDWPQLELVIGLHGFDRDHPRVREMEASFPRPLAVAEVPADRSLGDMLNQLCDLASGEVITKMDDDDWYSVHHVTDLVHAAEFSRADLVGSGAEFLYLEAADLTVRRHRSSGNRFTNRVPGAALLMSREKLRAVGGWRPIHRGLDTALARAVADSGGSIYRTHGLGIVVYRAAAGHTWDPGIEYFLRGDVDQWPGFMAPPGMVADPPIPVPVLPSWFDQQPGSDAT